MNRTTKFIIERSSGFLYLFVMIVSLLSISFESGSGTRIISETVMNATGFFQTLGSRTTTFLRDSVTSIRKLSRLQEDYEQLQIELSEFRTRAISFEEITRENAELRTLLGFRERESFQLIPSQIVAKTPGSLSLEFIIDKGSSDGVRANAPVITFYEGERVLVGKIEAISSRTSLVAPVFSTNLFVASRLSVNRYEGLVSGLGEETSELLMNYVPREARTTVGLGEKVVTSGLNSIYPAGITLGTVSSISAEPWETGLHLTIRPQVDISRLEYVFVLIREDAE
ncbi:MAG: rod shape-determining protein MreC [Spirochaetales bacterium]|nr:rod shape-determining protein MreC [Spirochaetales bacterium]